MRASSPTTSSFAACACIRSGCRAGTPRPTRTVTADGRRAETASQDSVAERPCAAPEARGRPLPLPRSRKPDVRPQLETAPLLVGAVLAVLVDGHHVRRSPVPSLLFAASKKSRSNPGLGLDDTARQSRSSSTPRGHTRQRLQGTPRY